VTLEELAQDPLISTTIWDILVTSSKSNQMYGPAFKYTREDFLNDASPEEWDAWEQKAAELELPLDYFLAEFV